MKNLSYLEPLSSRRNIQQRLLHRIHDRPPPLRLRIRRHPAHVGLVIAAVVFEVRNQKPIVKIDGIVPNITGVNRREHRRPNGLVILDVLLATFRPQPDQLAITAHESLRWKFKSLSNINAALDNSYPTVPADRHYLQLQGDCPQEPQD